MTPDAVMAKLATLKTTRTRIARIVAAIINRIVDVRRESCFLALPSRLG
jgi:acetolactate synthase small subunit